MARIVVPHAEDVARPGLCCRGWCYLPSRIADEVHDLRRNPLSFVVGGIPPVRVQRCMTGHKYIDRWFYVCHVPDCRVDSSDEVPGAHAWPQAYQLALDHLRKHHPTAGAAA
jgi:hypothetical protein